MLTKILVYILKYLLELLETKSVDKVDFKFDDGQKFVNRKGGEIKILSRKKNIRGTKMYKILLADGRITHRSEGSIDELVEKMVWKIES